MIISGPKNQLRVIDAGKRVTVVRYHENYALTDETRCVSPSQKPTPAIEINREKALNPGRVLPP